MLNAKRILVLAPHTDDGELGAGGLIHKYAPSVEKVYYAAFSRCDESLPKGFEPGTLVHECRDATALLGIPPENVEVMDFTVRRFHERRQDVLDQMIRLRKAISPTLVLAPNSNDVHQDHQIIHQEAMRAFKTTTLLGYELPWNSRRFDFDLVVGLSEANLAAKTAAMGAYKSQAARPYSQSDMLRAIAAYHGIKGGLPLAEAFEVLRWIDP
ncbi:MAG: PIG-L deacetylase family protein [Paracoccaceae bacterium]